MQTIIDLNCDLGEGMATDAAIMPFISSANISCGYHAGDNETILNTIQLCLHHGVSIGAHPSFHDRENFGRTERELEPNVITDVVIAQLSIMDLHCRNLGAKMHHVKPHGALYNMSARDETIATAIATAVFQFNPSLIMFGLAGSVSIATGLQLGLTCVHEFFADRTYQTNGSLTPRHLANALISDENQAQQQAYMIATKRQIVTNSGTVIQPCSQADAVSICLHGDGAHALSFAKNIHDMFLAKKILIKSV